MPLCQHQIHLQGTAFAVLNRKVMFYVRPRFPALSGKPDLRSLVAVKTLLGNANAVAVVWQGSHSTQTVRHGGFSAQYSL